MTKQEIEQAKQEPDCSKLIGDLDCLQQDLSEPQWCASCRKYAYDGGAWPVVRS